MIYFISAAQVFSQSVGDLMLCPKTAPRLSVALETYLSSPDQYHSQNGKEYYFTTHQDFERGISAGEFLEYAHVHSNIYGTSFRAVEDVAASGRCCVLDIDVQGARKVSILVEQADAYPARPYEQSILKAL